MIKRVININNYWKVIVYYNINYNFFHIIRKDLDKLNCTERTINTLYTNMRNNIAKAVTISNTKEYTSVVLFNIHTTKHDYINSIIHEAEHIKQSILKAYKIKDVGEPPAYTIAFIAMKMLDIIV